MDANDRSSILLMFIEKARIVWTWTVLYVSVNHSLYYYHIQLAVFVGINTWFSLLLIPGNIL